MDFNGQISAPAVGYLPSGMNRKQAALKTAKFGCRMVGKTAWNMAKLMFNSCRVAGGTVGAVIGGGIGLAGGAAYKGVQTLRHRQTKSILDYGIKAAQKGYKAGSLVGGVAGIGVMLTPSIAAAVGSSLVIGSVGSLVVSPLVYKEYKRTGETRLGNSLIKEIELPNQTIKHLENEFLNYKRASEVIEADVQPLGITELKDGSFTKLNNEVFISKEKENSA